MTSGYSLIIHDTARPHVCTTKDVGGLHYLWIGL